MFFLQAAQSRVPLRIGRKLLLKVPKLEIGDAIEWGAELLQKEVDRKTAGMTETQRAEFLNLYPTAGLDIQLMRTHVQTDEGAKWVIENCLAKAEAFLVTKENKKGEPTTTQKVKPLTSTQIQEYIRVNGVGRLLGLAWVLADLDDSSVMKPPADFNDETLEDNEGARPEPEDPLTDTGNAD